MKTIKQTYHIHAPIDEVWNALVDPRIIEKWGGGPAVMDDKEGTSFELWGGEMYGKNIKVVHGKKLVQEWFGGKWDKASIATFTLKKEDGNKTRVDLVHEDVPDIEAKEIEQGWKDYYLGPLKELVEKR